MEVLSVKDVTFRYEGDTEFQLKKISFDVKQGEMVLLCGPSGCGKTTLLRLLKKELMPVGERKGEIWRRYESGRIGYLFQNPDSQLVCRTVEEELVFGAENIGMPFSQMGRAVAEITAYLGIEGMLQKNTAELSGGQKQMVNLASVMMMKPKVLLLDEPTSQLDPVSTYGFWQLIRKLQEELNLTIVMVEHNLDVFLKEADRVLYMENGTLHYDGSRDGFVSRMLREKRSFCASLPKTIRLLEQSRQLLHEEPKQYPYTVQELLSCMDGRVFMEAEGGQSQAALKKKELVRIQGGYFRYEKNAEDVLKDLDLTLQPGSIYALIGGNGVGKSTLFSVLSGYRKLYRGSCSIKGRTGVLPQNPMYAFFKDVLYEDYKMLADEERIEQCLEQYEFCRGLRPYLKANPLDLSGGQMQKAAICKMLLLDAELLLMDEPVKALDGYEKALFRDLLEELLQAGKTILFTSHDLEFVEETAKECLMMFDGRIIARGSVDDMFLDNRFYTTVKGRIRGWIEDESDVMD